MRSSPLLGFLAALTALLLSAPAACAENEAPRLVVLGDSLSAGYGIHPEEGWVALLSRRLGKEGYGYRVVNASASGETSGGGLARLPRVLATHHPTVLVVELGANDGLRGLPLAELRKNLATIVSTAQAAHVAVLLVGMRIPPNYGPEYTSGFTNSFGEVSMALHTALVPFLLERVAANDANFQSDGLHPIASVQGLLLDTVWPMLKPLLHAGAAAAAAPPAARR